MRQALMVIGLSVALVFMPGLAAGGTAQARLSNNAVRMLPGDCSCGFGLIWTIHFSSSFTEDPPQANGELAPLVPPGLHSHWSYLVLEDPSLFASTTYAELDVPAGDADGNGTSDFYEVDRPISVTTAGRYAVVWTPGYGTLSLTWTRLAGSRSGSCQLYMNDPILGLMGPFNHTFELLGYEGTLTYTPGANTVTGNIQLTQPGSTTDRLEGPVTLFKAPTNRFNLLILAAGDWTHQSEVFSFEDCELVRAPARPTVYQGTLRNPFGTHQSWTLSLVDTNDTNRNGIPDLSDDVAVSPPNRPALTLARTPTHLLLRVRGSIGRSHQVQEARAASATNWSTVQTLTLTNDPQVVTLPLPAESQTFWRVQVE